MNEEISVYNADNEEPKCGRCDNVNNPYEWCTKYCGANNGWNGYKRTVLNEREE